ncbi:MAG: glycosyltransferase family 39 protein [Candidatus Omnitrophica bacterium]|nr:glycosyltransferase family 39 protein [Candidatus Omnitrophota bacterium]
MKKDRLAGLLAGKYFILCAVLGIAAFLRFYGLNGKCLWYDEVCSLNLSAYNWYDIFLSQKVLTDIPRPVYYALLKLWTGLFGYTEVAARSLAVIFGVLSVFLIYKLAKTLFGASAGLISAFILAISPYNIYYSQQVRYYTLFLCLSLVSIILFLKVIKSDKRSLRFLYILTNALILYSFPVGIYVFILQNIFFLVFSKRIRLKRQWLRMQVIILVIFMPMAVLPAVAFTQNTRNQEIDTFIADKPGYRDLIGTFGVFSYGGPRQAHAGVGFETEPSRLRVIRFLTVLLGLLFSLSIFYSRKEIRSNEDILSAKNKILLLWLWLLAPLLGFYLFSIWVKPVFLTRYFIAIAPAFYIGAAYSVSRMGRGRLPAIVALVALTFFSWDILYNPGSNDDWRSLASSVQPQIAEGDVLVFAPITQIIPFWYYYKYGQVKGFNNNIDNHGEKFYHMKNCRFLDGTNTVIGLGIRQDREHIRVTLGGLPDNDANIWLIISPHWRGNEHSGFIEGLLGKGRGVKYRKYFDYNGVEAICYSPSG